MIRKARWTRFGVMSRVMAAIFRRCRANAENGARPGATPLVVVEGAHVLGVIALKDIVKGGIKERSPSCERWVLNGDDHWR